MFLPSSAYCGIWGILSCIGHLSCCWNSQINRKDSLWLTISKELVCSGLVPKQKHHGRSVQWRKIAYIMAPGNQGNSTTGRGQGLDTVPKVKSPWPTQTQKHTLLILVALEPMKLTNLTITPLLSLVDHHRYNYCSPSISMILIRPFQQVKLHLF